MKAVSTVSTKRPNVLPKFVDNQPASMMGCYGNEEIFTPNLDNLASEGVLFRNAFCPNSMCSPCRASMLTASCHRNMESKPGSMILETAVDRSNRPYSVELYKKLLHWRIHPFGEDATGSRMMK